jgi:hypothetical protein
MGDAGVAESIEVWCIAAVLAVSLVGCGSPSRPLTSTSTSASGTTTSTTVTTSSPPTHNPNYKHSEIAGVDMPLGAKLTLQKPGLEVWETLDTQQQTLNHFYATGTVLPFCRGKFTSTGKNASYGLFYGTAHDGIELIVNDYSVWISRGANPDFPPTCS